MTVDVMKNNTYVKDTRYIDGLKGLACFMIMVSHYLDVYHAAESFNTSYRIVDFLYASPIRFLLGGSFWIYLFFTISGYLLSKENLKTFVDTVFKCIHRFVRLALPILFSYLFIYTILFALGSHNKETIVVFENSWYQKYYSQKYSLTDVLCGPIDVLLLGKATLNAPYWVLRDMFFSSLIIYSYSYFKNRLHISDEMFFLIGILTMVIASFKKPIITACMAGALLGFCQKRQESFFHSGKFGLGMILTVLFFYRTSKEILSTTVFISVILFLPQIKILNDLFKSGIMKFLGRISWGVYSFHWPLMCSVGGLMLLHINGISQAYIVSFIVCMILTILVSFIYSLTLAKLEKSIALWFDQVLISIKRQLIKN